jgi:hypothetical protein
MGILSSHFTLVFSYVRSNPKYLMCVNSYLKFWKSISCISFSLQQFNQIINIVLGVALAVELFVASVFENKLYACNRESNRVLMVHTISMLPERLLGS